LLAFRYLVLKTKRGTLVPISYKKKGTICPERSTPASLPLIK
jgi:hypothetical protein